MRNLRPILLRVIAAMLIGAVVTVGVAVRCALIPRQPPAPTPVYMAWMDHRTNQVWVWSGVRHEWHGCSGALMHRGAWSDRTPGKVPDVASCPFPYGAMGPTTKGFARVVRTAGWPVACVWGAVETMAYAPEWTPLNWTPPMQPEVAVGAISIGRPLAFSEMRGIWGYLPVMPIWSGLVLNTLCYGTAAWVLLSLVGTLRRWRRRRGGKCVNCGYDRAGLTVEAACPECGGGAAR